MFNSTCEPTPQNSGLVLHFIHLLLPLVLLKATTISLSKSCVLINFLHIISRQNPGVLSSEAVWLVCLTSCGVFVDLQ